MDTPDLKPVTVVVPHIASRDVFFRRFCLPSIQANRPQQLIVVNDGHGGPAKRRNHGAAQATNPYIFFCDDDIVLGIDCLERLLAALEANPSAGYAYCEYMGFMVPGAPMHQVQGPVFHMKSGPFNPGELRTGNYISTMSLVRREVFPGFDETLPQLEDWDLWLTLLERGVHGIYVPEVLFHAYYLDYGISASANRNIHSAMNLVLNKHFPG